MDHIALRLEAQKIQKVYKAYTAWLDCGVETDKSDCDLIDELQTKMFLALKKDETLYHSSVGVIWATFVGLNDNNRRNVEYLLFKHCKKNPKKKYRREKALKECLESLIEISKPYL